ncbi:neurogenic differentiation factor 1-like [Stylophora pistillata]|nr:neurogenic differentiation factor 1-like [Stylophora pistillata]
MEDIFHGSFYTEPSFDGAFFNDGFTPENRAGFGLTDEQLNSIVKYRDIECPSTANTAEYHELSTLSYDKTPQCQASCQTLLDSTPTALEVLDEICLGNNTLENTETTGTYDDNACSRQSCGQPLKKMRRLRANDRERRRMRSLNRALESLKKCLPVPQSKRRVTKLEILRIACNYIRSLSDALSEDSRGNDGPSRGRKSRSRGIVGDPVVNGFSVAQRLEILSGNNTNRI